MEKTLVAITGASSGIGEAFARKLAPGHNLLLIARRKDRLEALAAEFSNKFGTYSDILQADLTNDDDLQATAERIRSEQHLGLLINNAGFGTQGRFWEADLSGQEKMHKLHVTATVILTHAALGNMVRQDFGGVINVASVSSFVRGAGTTSYSATKAWMAAFTEGLYLDLQQAGSSVVVQALCPGFTYSEFMDTMGVDRSSGMGPAWWLTAEYVVQASLDGLRRGQVFVVPGWRYKVLTAILPRLPQRLRLAIAGSADKIRQRRLPAQDRSSKQIQGE